MSKRKGRPPCAAGSASNPGALGGGGGGGGGGLGGGVRGGGCSAFLGLLQHFSSYHLTFLLVAGGWSDRPRDVEVV
jgi:hypothetical protein